MSSRSAALLAVLTAAACGRSGIGGRAGAVPFEGRTWHSWDVTFSEPAPPHGAVLDTSASLRATLECWRSQGTGNSDFASGFDRFTAGSHSDAFNKVSGWWSPSAQNYPYCGKSEVARGDDSSESGDPAPSGVLDLQLHPPDTAELVVAAFVVPTAGIYSITDYAARRVDPNGNSVFVGIYVGNNVIGSSVMEVEPDRAWDVVSGETVIGALSSGDTIRFVVQRNANFDSDATEISWTIRSLP